MGNAATRSNCEASASPGLHRSPCIWFATCISHVWIEEKHKDYFVMFIHHLVTIALVWGSWCFGYLRIGILVMYVHDFSDIFIDIMKLANYAKLQGSSAFFIVEISFVSTLVSWFYIRLYVFPVKVIHSCYVHSLQWWFHNGNADFDIINDNWLAGKTVP